MYMRMFWWGCKQSCLDFFATRVRVRQITKWLRILRAWRVWWMGSRRQNQMVWYSRAFSITNYLHTKAISRCTGHRQKRRRSRYAWQNNKSSIDMGFPLWTRPVGYLSLVSELVSWLHGISVPTWQTLGIIRGFRIHLSCSGLGLRRLHDLTVGFRQDIDNNIVMSSRGRHCY